MRCQDCGQVSDWAGDGGNWTRVSDAGTSVRPLLECEQCGHTQWAR
ncbi:MAG: hypothetical protein V5A62_10905 [Haloarculaceae archaeon]